MAAASLVRHGWQLRVVERGRSDGWRGAWRPQLERQHVELDKMAWDLPNERSYLWYLDIFSGLMTTIKNKAGWYHSRILWSLVFMQNTNGSFEISPNLAAVLCAGDTSYLITDKPTGRQAANPKLAIRQFLFPLFASLEGKATARPLRRRVATFLKAPCHPIGGNSKALRCWGPHQYFLRAAYIPEDTLKQSTPPELFVLFPDVGLAHRIWATMCAVERIKQLPFEWIINPEDPPRERRTLTEIANTYIDNQFRTMELNPAISLMLITMTEEVEASKTFKRLRKMRSGTIARGRQGSVEKKVRHKAKEAVEAWVKVHVLAMARLKRYVQMNLEQECSAAREQPVVSVRERRDELWKRTKANPPTARVISIRPPPGPCT
ncbi:hypothetical protein CYMTET_7639 [Cymbomonas tetramitiformis]|uniref:Uncharacterized protein n=1 Tax=Cymbomonas tetramitiformis TaxID=36881 RepID=A0AAE0GVA4_9CHLO|nr:hypothetical protein CYMTET_7639 [Cymbomonas tetramitiformis]